MPLHFSESFLLRLPLPALVLLAGSLAGDIDAAGLLIGISFCCWVLIGPRRLAPRLWWGVCLLASLALLAQLVPGFTQRPLWPALQLSPDAPRYQLRLAWESLLVAATLLAAWRPPRLPIARPGLLLLCALATLAAVPALALLLGVVGWQPKWPEFLPAWMLVNLCVTALSEELVFRGWLQPALVKRCGAPFGIALGALLFGAAHAPFSAGFALVAGIAGLGYGLVFHLGGRLWPAVALHFAVNLLHLLLLSYPLKLT